MTAKDGVVGFLGGTGIEAKGLALRFARAGMQVVLGSRSAERAMTAAEACNKILGIKQVRGSDNRDMFSEAALIFLTVPFQHAPIAVDQYRAFLSRRHIVVDVTVPLRFQAGRAEIVAQESASNSEVIARHLPEGVPLVAAFKTIPAAILSDLETPLECDVFVCGDDAEARNAVIAAAARIPSLRPLDAGPLSTAAILERMTLLAVQLNRFYHRKGARFRIEGV